MTALADAPATAKAENTQDSRETKGNRAANRPSFTGNVRELFRKAKDALTRKSPAPEPQPARRRKEDTGGLFKLARRILRRAPKLPAEAYAPALAFLSDTLDWLNLWGNDDSYDPAAEAGPARPHGPTNGNPLSLNL